MVLKDEFENEGNWLFRYRSYLPVVALVSGLFVYVFMSKRMEFRACYEYLCLSVCVFGFAIRVLTVGFTPVGTSGRNTESQVADSLNTTGAYSVVRHPLYLGNFFMYLGVAMLTSSVGFVAVFVLAFWLYYERIMYAEEQFLGRKFGSYYSSWASSTPAFIPSLKRYKPSKYPFSWKKVLKKEKNGFFALFLIFFIFDAAGQQAGLQQRLNVTFLVMAVAAGAAYSVLEYMKKKTNLLDEDGR